ncbi:hypothetical protein QBC37DRAFT_399856 [Rhypophila decipiens]|uniref:Uncharacterized protein n=1 Tax=Rhypophila decipiens TaxID=261697 RepID=A0AAN6Y861_9PEZI|nr:hypothetical protein QBC37DRAFT_399856 [Rhypophila decipiens]
MNGNTESTSFGVRGEEGNVSTASPVLSDAVPDSRPRTTANPSPTGPPNALFPDVAQASTTDTPSQQPVAIPSFLHPYAPTASPVTSTSLHRLDTEHPIQAQARDVPKPNNNNCIEENPVPCLRCVSYMLSYPAKAQNEVDKLLGQGIVCARFKNEKKTGAGSSPNCLRCRTRDASRHCLPIPPQLRGLVLEMVQEHKAYVKWRYPENSEPGLDRVARKLHLLSNPVLYDSLAAIGYFDDIATASLPLIRTFSFEEGAQIRSEITARVSSSRIRRQGASYGAANSGISARGGNSGQVQRNPTAPRGLEAFSTHATGNQPGMAAPRSFLIANSALTTRAPRAEHERLSEGQQPPMTVVNPNTSRRNPNLTSSGPGTTGGSTSGDYFGGTQRSIGILPVNLHIRNTMPSQSPEMSSKNRKRLEEESKSPDMDRHKKRKLGEGPTSKKVVENEDTGQ